MDTPTNGTPNPAEQAPASIQQIVEQPNQTPQTPAVTPAQPAYTPEQVAQWQQQAQEAEKYKKQYDSLLPEYTRSRQALAQLAGGPQQPQQNDPYARVVEFAKSKGYDPETARGIAEMADLVAQDRTNTAINKLAFQQVGNQIPIVMQQAWQQVPAALGNPKVQELVQTHLHQLAQEGNFDLINPQYVANYAKIAAFDAGAWTPQAQQTTQPNPFAQGMFGIQPGYSQTSQAQPKQDAPKTAEVISDLKSRYGDNIK